MNETRTPCLGEIIVAVWRGRGASQQWKDVMIEVLHMNKYRTECDNYRNVSLVAHADKGLLIVLLKVNRGSIADAREGILSEEQCGFRLRRSTIDMMFVVRRLQEPVWKDTPLYMYFIDLTKAYVSVDRTLLWVVVAATGRRGRTGDPLYGRRMLLLGRGRRAVLHRQ